jgi:hypothetical protein
MYISKDILGSRVEILVVFLDDEDEKLDNAQRCDCVRAWLEREGGERVQGEKIRRFGGPRPMSEHTHKSLLFEILTLSINSFQDCLEKGSPVSSVVKIMLNNFHQNNEAKCHNHDRQDGVINGRVV